MNKFRYVSKLSETQREELEKLNKSSSSARVRTRAHAILLSSEGFTIEELMEIFQVERDTISRWLNNWEQSNFEGLPDKIRSGRTPTLNEDEQSILKQLILDSPRSSKVVAQQLFKKTGKSLSHWSIKRLAKEFGLSWKRIRKSLKSKRDEDEFNKAKSELEALSRVALIKAENNQTVEPSAKAKEQDIEVFERLINIEQIIISDTRNKEPVVSPEPFEVATKTDSYFEEVVLNLANSLEEEVVLNLANSDEEHLSVATQKDSSFEEVVLNLVTNDEDYQCNETNELQMNKESESEISEIEEVACLEHEIHDNCPKILAIPSEVETDFVPKLNSDKSFNKDIFDIVYFDATGFDLVPSVPYAWQSVGRKNTICVPSVHSERINVLGFLNKMNNELTPFVIEATVNTDVIVAAFEAFSKQIHNPTHVVMDNASIHTSHHFLEQIESWQEKGLFPYFLPTYSPELNAIEILWRKIKYEWLPFSAYESFKKLQEAVDEVLIHFGSKYLITFA